jgi:hypothetical protein
MPIGRSVEPVAGASRSAFERSSEISEILAASEDDRRKRAEKLIELAGAFAAGGDDRLAQTALDAATFLCDSPPVLASARALNLRTDDEAPPRTRRRLRPVVRLGAVFYGVMWRRTRRAHWYTKWNECWRALADADR